MPGLDPRPLAVVTAIVLAVGSGVPRAQQPPADASPQAGYDQLLDVNVRDGLVYYRALKAERGRLDRYVESLRGASVASASREEQMAFWLNAYNALVLRTVVDNYPINQRTKGYPARSIRQIPGAFERLQHRIAGRALTLDQIEQTVLPAFKDPRVFLALGRGAVGGSRLRSEAYTPEALERQLSEQAAECINHVQCVHIDSAANSMQISSIFSWRRNEFIEGYADKADAMFASRSLIERAVLAFISPRLLTAERELLARNEFKVEYRPFDWSLNDLTGRGGR